MAKRQVFYSFHYNDDSWRAAQIRNIGVIDGNTPASDNDWETVKKGGDAAIKNWIGDQMKGRTCTVVLIGAKTAGRKWITYEISKSWNDGKGILGIYIHKLEDKLGNQTTKGDNPFDSLTSTNVINIYDPPYSNSKQVYDHIKNNIAAWIELAIRQRG
jgi:hypothetical protein